MRCYHLSKSIGLVDTPLGREPEYECRHPKHKKTTIAQCLLCGDYRRLGHPADMIVNRRGESVDMSNIFSGASCFLALSGPSIRDLDLSLLSRRGVVIMGVNNSPAALPCRPHIWTHSDPTQKFHDAIWRDPAVLKFAPVNLWHHQPPKQKKDKAEWTYHGLRSRNLNTGALEVTNEAARDMPGVFGYKRNHDFRPDQWLYEPSVNTGNSKKSGNAEWRHTINTMFSAVRLAFYLGFKNLYLLGCDFRMNVDQPYSFKQDKHAGGVRQNNRHYMDMNAMFAALAPHFARVGFEVYNCTPRSGFFVFPHMPFDEAISRATNSIPQEMNTEGWYVKYKSSIDD